MSRGLFWIFAIGLFLRLLLIPNPGFEADVAFWKSWGLATIDRGIVEGMKVTNNNYPTPFAYVLGAMVWLYQLFADPHNFSEFWTNTNLLFLTIAKLPAILADLGIAAVILWIGKNAKRLGFPEVSFSIFGLSFYKLLAIYYLLSPVGLIDGALWGQVDSLGVFIFLIALIMALEHRPFLAGVIYMVALMTKLQNMIYGPLLFLFIWQSLGFGGLVKAGGGATLAFFGLNLEFLMARNMDRVIASLTENYDYFPLLSLNAFNLWWIVARGQGMQLSDKLAALGIINAKTLGLIIFSAFYLFAAARQLIGASARAVLIKTFLEGLIIVNAAFFLFQTQSHDRYLFPLTVFLLLWAVFLRNVTPNHAERKFKLFSIFYFLFTIFYFYNLHTALVVNYPSNGLPLLSSLTQPLFTIGTAIALLALFGGFLFVLLRTSQISRYLLLISGFIFLFFLLTMNYELLTKRPLSLVRFTPFISQQDYGGRQTNRNVQSSFGGPTKWTRLSVQYAFYKQGIGTHANSKHVFDINRKFKKFTTDYGIDTEAGTRASAIFEVYGDGQLLWRSEKVGRFDMPQHAEVDISGVKYLTLVTTDAGDNNFDDHTDWLRPTLWP